jgi:hypothetical protein
MNPYHDLVLCVYKDNTLLNSEIKDLIELFETITITLEIA